MDPRGATPPDDRKKPADDPTNRPRQSDAHIFGRDKRIWQSHKRLAPISGASVLRQCPPVASRHARFRATGHIFNIRLNCFRPRHNTTTAVLKPGPFVGAERSIAAMAPLTFHQTIGILVIFLAHSVASGFFTQDVFGKPSGGRTLFPPRICQTMRAIADGRTQGGTGTCTTGRRCFGSVTRRRWRST